jgi:hypothetical protein
MKRIRNRSYEVGGMIDTEDVYRYASSALGVTWGV